jgi:hypothetical protein
MVVNIQIMLPDDMQIVLVYQGIIGYNGTGNGIFNGHHPLVCPPLEQLIYQLVKSKAFHQSSVITKILANHLMVVRTPDSLYGYFECQRLRFISKKSPVRYGTLFYFIVSNILKLSRTPLSKEVKVKPVPEIIACHVPCLKRLR